MTTLLWNTVFLGTIYSSDELKKTRILEASYFFNYFVFNSDIATCSHGVYSVTWTLGLALLSYDSVGYNY